MIARAHISESDKARRIVPPHAANRTYIPRKRDNVLIVVDAEELLKHRARQIILIIDHYGRAVKPAEYLRLFIL
jgi:hypothetical protein